MLSLSWTKVREGPRDDRVMYGSPATVMEYYYRSASALDRSRPEEVILDARGDR